MIHASGTGFAAELTLDAERVAPGPEQEKAPAGEDRRALLASEGLKSGQSLAGATMVGAIT